MLFSVHCSKLKNLKLQYSLIIVLFESMHAFHDPITPLGIIRPEHSRTISGPWGLYTPMLPNNFSRYTLVRNCPKPGTYLYLSEPRPTLGKQLAQGH